MFRRESCLATDALHCSAWGKMGKLELELWGKAGSCGLTQKTNRKSRRDSTAMRGVNIHLFVFEFFWCRSKKYSISYDFD